MTGAYRSYQELMGVGVGEAVSANDSTRHDGREEAVIVKLVVHLDRCLGAAINNTLTHLIGAGGLQYANW